MQVVKPIDVEDALRIDLQALMPNARCFAQPAPPDIKPGDVMVTALGGSPASAATSVYDVSIDCWGADEGYAVDLANIAAGYVSSLPLRDTATEWKTARTNPPYINPDPKRPGIPRATFSASVIARGNSIDF